MLGLLIRGAALAAFVGLLALGCKPLSAVLLLALPAGLLLAPGTWWRRWLGLLGVVLLAAAGAAVPVAMAMGLAAAMNANGPDAACVHWPSVAVQMWCGAGLFVLCAVGLARLGHVMAEKHPALRLLAISIVTVLMVLLAVPLASIYRSPITSDLVLPPAGVVSVPFDLRSRDGTRLACCWHQGVNEPRGVVVFTHGVGAWSENFYRHRNHLLGLGWAVCTYDLRGHGKSDAAATTYGIAESDDLLAVWQCARARIPGKPAVLYGVSMGATITLIGAPRCQGCAAVIAESPFNNLGQMSDRVLPLPLRWSARVLALVGLGFLLDDVDAGTLGAGGTAPLLIGGNADDVVVPFAQTEAASQALRTAQPGRSVRLVRGTSGGHLGLLLDQGWLTALAATLDAAAASGSGENQPPPKHNAPSSL